MSHPVPNTALVADVGGTNTRVALAQGRRVLEESVKRFENDKFADLDSVLRRYLAEAGALIPAAACVAMAGPVRDGRAVMTNLGWSMDKAGLAAVTGAPVVAILNDLQAQGHALGHIDDRNIRILTPFSAANAHAAKLVIGVGTGFNAAPVFDTEAGRFVPPSESGHVNLPIRDAADLAMGLFVAAAKGCPSVEDVLSGRGVEAVYRWHVAQNTGPQDLSAHDIMTAVQAGTNPQATATARVMTRMLAEVAGNLALIQLPFGGVYLVGGVARSLAPYLTDFGFAAAFRNKGRFSEFMGNFGVGVIEDDYAALTGCAAHLVALGG
jgi:glucokinase